jgi:hypothetical protein
MSLTLHRLAVIRYKIVHVNKFLPGQSDDVHVHRAAHITAFISYKESSIANYTIHPAHLQFVEHCFSTVGRKIDIGIAIESPDWDSPRTVGAPW